MASTAPITGAGPQHPAAFTAQSRDKVSNDTADEVLMEIWKGAVLAAIAVAAVSTVAGAASLIAWDNRPAPAGNAPRRWPEHATARLSPGKPTLLVFAHPRCACTGATIEELSGLLAKLGAGAAQPHIAVLFSRPSGNKDWVEGPTWPQARKQLGPGVGDFETVGKFASVSIE